MSQKITTQKMKKAVCSKCTKHIINREFLKCCHCNKTYDLGCTNVTQKRFNLMENKLSWKCNECHSHDLKNNDKQNKKNSFPSNSITVSSTPTKAYVTFRRQNQNKHDNLINKLSPAETSTKNSFESLPTDDEESTVAENYTLNRSCPELGTITEDTLDDYRSKITTLELKLQSAENEIQNLLLENCSLQKRVNENNITIKRLTQICSNTSTPKIQKNKIMEKGILNFNQSKMTSTHNVSKTTKTSTITTEITQVKARINQPTQLAVRSTVKNKKIAIISTTSSRNNNIMVKNMLNYFDEFSCYHLGIPGGGINQLIKGLQNEIQDYTMQDFCIVMIGDQDFRTSNHFNAKALVHELRLELGKVKHTNVILCTPTYICGAPLYNYRVEIFNKYLIDDIQTHKYSYVLDSNLNVTFDMFSYSTGKITNIGIKNVFADIQRLLRGIEYEPIQATTKPIEKKNNKVQGTIPYYFKAKPKPTHEDKKKQRQKLNSNTESPIETKNTQDFFR